MNSQMPRRRFNHRASCPRFTEDAIAVIVFLLSWRLRRRMGGSEWNIYARDPPEEGPSCTRSSVAARRFEIQLSSDAVRIGCYDTHPGCDLFPLMSDEDLAALADDIGRNGLHTPIIIHEGRILDGRNR